MNKASASGQILVSANGTTYIPVLLSNIGDLYQHYQAYDSGTGAVTGVPVPNFEQIQPELELYITDASQASGLARPGKVDWYFGDEMLTFGSDNISTNTFNGETGHFKRINGTDSTNYKLKILKNLVKAAGGVSEIIKAVATIAQGATSVKITAQTTVSITPGSESTDRVTIGWAQGSGQFITNTVKQVTLVCLLNAATPPSGYAYQWSQLSDTGEFVDITSANGGTGQTLTVKADDINRKGVYRVIMTKGVQEVGRDTEVVEDQSDPLILLPNPSISSFTKPTDECIFDPKVRRVGSSTDEEGYNFTFVYFDPAGNNIIAQDPDNPKKITYGMAQQAGNAINYYITGSN